MRVFNLTPNNLVYKGKTLPPNGGSSDYDIDFIPDRDKALAKAGKIAFGTLPIGWAPEVMTTPTPVSETLKHVLPPATVEEAPAVLSKTEFKEEKEARKKKF